MGNEKGYDDEKPVHSVEITKDRNAWQFYAFTLVGFAFDFFLLLTV